MRIRLKEIRESRNISQIDLAKMVDKSSRSIQKWESGDTFPNADVAWRLCEILDTDPNTLLGWYDAHPEDLDTSLTKDESLLLSDYRQCTPERRRTIAAVARDLGDQSKEEEKGSLPTEEVVA